MRRRWVLIRINFLTALMVSAFLCRSVLVFIGDWVTLSSMSTGYVDLVYYSFLEILPLGCMLVVLNSGSAPNRKGYTSMNTPPITDTN